MQLCKKCLKNNKQKSREKNNKCNAQNLDFIPTNNTVGWYNMMNGVFFTILVCENTFGSKVVSVSVHLYDTFMRLVSNKYMRICL